MRLGLWQGPSPQGDIDLAFETLRAAIMAAGAMGARMLVAPEVFLPGYNMPDLETRAMGREGPWQMRLAAMCRTAGCGICLGYAERDGATLFNAAMAIGADGAILGHYRKIQLYGPRERAVYAPGDAYCVFDLDGIRAAILICYDIEFAPHVAALAAQGVRLVLVPTANMAPFVHVCEVTVPAMAANHAVAIVYANYCGVEGDLTYMGGSVIVAPDGKVVGRAGAGPALLVADIGDPDPSVLSTQARDFRAVRLTGG